MSAPRELPIGIVYDMPFADYLAVDAVSASGLRVFARSPWHYKNRIEVAPTRKILRGTLAHCAVLEPDALDKRYAIVPENAPRRPTKSQWSAKNPSEESKAAMAWWSDFQGKCAGREIVPAEDFDITRKQLSAIAAEPELAAAFKSGQGETSIFWIDEETGLYCKARPDWICDPVDGACDVLDLKTTADESPNGFGRIAARMKYHIQFAHYVDGVESCCAAVGKFIFAAVTSAPPVLAVPYVLTDEIEAQAIDERRELLERMAWCKKHDTWPAYGSGVQLLDFPAYAKRSAELEIGYAD